MSVLVDTSAWVEFIRNSGTPTHREVRNLLSARDGFSVTGPIIMEVTAGANDDLHAESLQWLFSDADKERIDLSHYEEAAAVYRSCRSQGLTVRSMIDCIIAAVALRDDLELLHSDRDFNAIASVLPLRIHPASAA